MGREDGLHMPNRLPFYLKASAEHNSAFKKKSLTFSKKEEDISRDDAYQSIILKDRWEVLRVTILFNFINE